MNFFRKTKSYRKGFTLIELLVVIAVTTVIVAIVVPYGMNARRNGRNQTRYQLLRNTQIALEQYYAKYKQYPSTCLSGGVINNNGLGVCPSVAATAKFWSFSATGIQYNNEIMGANKGSGKWIPALVPEFMPALPLDPLVSAYTEKVLAATSDGSCSGNSNGTIRFWYRSSGYNYKLTLQCGYEGSLPVPDEYKYLSQVNLFTSTMSDMRYLTVYSKPLEPGEICTLLNTNAMDKPACWQ